MATMFDLTPAEEVAVYVLQQMSEEEDAALTEYLDGRSSD